MRTIFTEAIVITIAATAMLTIAAHTHIPELFQIIPLFTPAKALWVWKQFGPEQPPNLSPAPAAGA